MHLPLPSAARTATIPHVTTVDVATDGELLSRVGSGDRAAFEELYRRFARPVLGLALRRLGDRGRAEDATQEAFASVWRSARSYDPARGSGAPWLYAVARNAIVDGLRKTPEPVAEPPDTPSARPDRPSRPRPAGSRGACTARSRCCPSTRSR